MKIRWKLSEDRTSINFYNWLSMTYSGNVYINWTLSDYIHFVLIIKLFWEKYYYISNNIFPTDLPLDFEKKFKRWEYNNLITKLIRSMLLNKRELKKL